MAQSPVLVRSYPEDSSLAAQDTVALRIRNNISFTRVDREADMVSIGYRKVLLREAASIVVHLSMELYTELSTRQTRSICANSAVEFLENERQRIENRLNRRRKSACGKFMNQESRSVREV
ncbi:MAG: hypothetical protein U5J63_08145 [Fodinibius sp.]|nr:hypothetical protein [Fodinibius sp.]